MARDLVVWQGEAPGGTGGGTATRFPDAAASFIDSVSDLNLVQVVGDALDAAPLLSLATQPLDTLTRGAAGLVGGLGDLLETAAAAPGALTLAPLVTLLAGTARSLEQATDWGVMQRVKGAVNNSHNFSCEVKALVDALTDGASANLTCQGEAVAPSPGQSLLAVYSRAREASTNLTAALAADGAAALASPSTTAQRLLLLLAPVQPRGDAGPGASAVHAARLQEAAADLNGGIAAQRSAALSGAGLRRLLRPSSCALNTSAAALLRAAVHARGGGLSGTCCAVQEALATVASALGAALFGGSLFGALVSVLDATLAGDWLGAAAALRYAPRYSISMMQPAR